MLQDPPPPRWRPRYRCAEKRETPDLSCICLSQWSLSSYSPLSRLIGKATLWQTRELTGRGKRRQESVQPRDNDITVISVSDFVSLLRRILCLPEGRRNSRVSSRQRQTTSKNGFLDTFPCSVSKIRSRRKKNETGKMWKERGFINDTRQGNFYFLNWIRDRFEIEGNFRMRRVKLQGKRIERQREGTI